ncbi:HK97-gp10 family putative phage morphogenesis protein [Ramlibacter sp. AN1015]|uniref:HK97-gp10 family putative phage morphogenesis protein n=1 Tax=Ramlibacter sp. AN1015 TaxID=3133428 RepID=UPI0030BE1264
MSGVKDKVLGIKTRLRNFRHEFGKEFVERVKQKTPVITGTLQQGWEYQLKEQEVEVRNKVPYASFVEYGTSKMEPRAMLQTTREEAEQIAQVAKERAERKK